MNSEEIIKRQNASIEEFAKLLSTAYETHGNYRYDLNELKVEIERLKEEINVLKNQES